MTASIAAATAATPAAHAPGPMAEMLGRMLADAVLQSVAETTRDPSEARRCTPDVALLTREAQASLEADFTPEQRWHLDAMASSSGARRIEARTRNRRLEAMGEAPEPLPALDAEDSGVMAAFGASPLSAQFDAWLNGMGERDDAPMQRAADDAERACLPQQAR